MLKKIFKNNVFKISVDTKEWFKATCTRCVRTFASTMVAILPTSAATLGSVDWGMCFSTAALATVVIFFTCVAGVPEVKATSSR